jgi:hypothetical protein
MATATRHLSSSTEGKTPKGKDQQREPAAGSCSF